MSLGAAGAAWVVRRQRCNRCHVGIGVPELHWPSCMRPRPFRTRGAQATCSLLTRLGPAHQATTKPAHACACNSTKHHQDMFPEPHADLGCAQEDDEDLEEVSEGEPEPVEEADEVKRKRKALELKDRGNSAYKAKRLDEALQLYDQAWEAWDGDISFLTNRCLHGGGQEASTAGSKGRI